MTDNIRHLHVAPPPAYPDPAATLRRLADEIEAGVYGPVGCVGIVVMGDTVETLSAGPDSSPAATAMLLHAGFARLSRAIEEHGRG